MFDLQTDVPLAPRTTLGVGGAARFFARCETIDALREALRYGREHRLSTFVLGGGSNVLVADSGFDGLVLEYCADEIVFELDANGARARAEAGASWDDLVARSVDAGLIGIEAMSGIPGRVGAAPMQNIGAYGQEVAEVIEEVEVVERASGEARRLRGEECGFAYRDSRFKGEWKDRFVITAVTFRLRRGAPEIRYAELARRLESETSAPSAARVRETVLELRRGKSMVLPPLLAEDDPNRRSAGSFFTNPIVTPDVAERAREVFGDPSMPAFPAGDGAVKLSAAWLIERSGFPKGFRFGRAGLSSNHCLALINPGDATAADLVDLAEHIRRGVEAKCGVVLVPEPVFLGF